MSRHSYLLRMAWTGMFLFLVQAYAFSQTDRPRTPSKDIVELIHSDNLRHNQFLNPDARILTGNVHLFHNGIQMYCDSAYQYETTNSVEAFGHVKIIQGDTLSLTGDYLFYDGNTQLAQVRHNVVMTHRESTLYTDSLNYDRLYNIGYFFEGGRLVDGDNVLTSDWGEYFLNTKEALFNYNVHLTSPKFDLTSDTLHYNTQTKWAEVMGPSNIKDKENNIYTEHAYYNTTSENVRLMDRSVVANKNGRQMVGDSISYDKQSGMMRAFGNVIYDDKANKNMLTGEYCQYNELTGQAYATDKALLKDYSNITDTLFVHADTLRLFTYNMDTDSVYRVLHGYFHVRAYRSDVQAVCDSLVYNTKDSCLTMYKDPIVWNDNRQLLGEIIEVFMKDSTIDYGHVINQALSIEMLHDSTHYNQIASREMFGYFNEGELRETEAVGNVQCVYYFQDDKDSSLVNMAYLETDTMRMFMLNRQLQSIWTCKQNGVMYSITQIPPSKDKLPMFAWFDYIRPVDKYDIFNWRGKGKGQELKNVNRRSAPLQFIGPDGKVTDKNTIEAADTLPELLDSVAVEAADSSAAAPTVAAETADVPVAGHEAVPSGGEDGDGQPADAPKAVPASEVKAVKEE